MSNKPPPGGSTPQSRRDRRESARRDRRLEEARTAAPRPAWQSPMALITVAAVAVGLIVVLLASGVLGGNGGGSTGDLLVPLRPTPADLVDPTNPRAVGPASAPVTVDIWSDFQCPYCGDWARQTAPDLISTYVASGKVRLVYRDLAFIDGGDPTGESHVSAVAARCAGDQGKFWAFHDYLFENQNGENKGTFSRAKMDQIATAVGLDMTTFASCMSGSAALAAVTAETAQGSQAGVTSTPTIAINGVLQRAGALPMEDSSSGPGLRTLIEAELAKVSPAPSAPGSAAPSATAAP
jgi:protein-disulfide isomerase